MPSEPRFGAWRGVVLGSEIEGRRVGHVADLAEAIATARVWRTAGYRAELVALVTSEAEALTAEWGRPWSAPEAGAA
ncbi:hypothetical protein ACFRSX_31125 [Streptomyces goshikiensis]|uniref:hypothetical protein n=1 Tax=Streptomyces TaxID=1883 RepID=UPI000C279728|nr:hypothetical protein [Streptomyces sp. CB02120-2]PJN14620.1 hypothetical protein CG724_33595 [Streptomyces sp. CB02120-2]